MPKAAEKIDSMLRVVTPENIEFEYRLAGPFRRLPAYVIDLALMAFVMFVASWIVSLTIIQVSSLVGIAVLQVCWFLLSWFYGGLFETFMNGQTPGKRLLGLRVLTETGEPIDAMQAILRNMIRTVDVLIPFVGLALMTSSRKYQRLGDLVCGTIVVVEEKHWLLGLAKLDDPRAIQLAAFLPPNFVVSRSLSRAIATYVERRRFFSVPRRREVARHLGKPLLEEFGLPADTSYDLLLCAIYYRTFIADSADDERQLAAARVAVATPISGKVDVGSLSNGPKVAPLGAMQLQPLASSPSDFRMVDGSPAPLGNSLVNPPWNRPG